MPDQTSPEIQSHYMCPSIRLVRLYEAVCDYQTNGWVEHCESELELVSKNTATLTTLVERAKAEGICVWERTAPLEDILYTPVEVDLDDVNQGIANR